MKISAAFAPFFAMTLLLNACSPRLDSSSFNGSFASAVVDTDAGDPVYPLVKKVRVRTVKGKKIFEYLEPVKPEALLKKKKSVSSKANLPKETWRTVGTIETYPAGSQFYHWGPQRDVEYWAKNGITSADIDSAVRRYNDSDRVGGGFYVSIDPIDTISYGQKVIVAEPKHMVTVLNINEENQEYDRAAQAIIFYRETNGRMDLDQGVDITVAKMAEAGIEAIRYSDTWLVTIRGSFLENLFEGNWLNFTKQMKNKKQSYYELGQFAMKYPLTAEVSASSAFKAQMPKLAKYLNKESMTESETDQLASELSADLSEKGAFYYGKPMKELFAEEVWQPLLKKVETAYKKDLLKRVGPNIQLYVQRNDIGGLIDFIGQYQLTLKDIFPEHEPLLDSKINGVSQTGTAIAVHSQAMVLSANASALGAYRLVAKMLAGDQEPWLFEADPKKTVRNEIANIYSFQKSEIPESFLKMAKFIAGHEVHFRETPQSIGGNEFLEGDNKPGYLEITSLQKTELDMNPFTSPVFKEKLGPNAQKRFLFALSAPVLKTLRTLKAC